MRRRSPRLLAVKKEVGNSSTEHDEIPENEEIPMAPGDQTYHLSDNAPFFDMVLTKSYADSAWQLFLPATAALSVLPSTALPVPVVLSHGGKSWTVQYSGGPSTRPKFNKWKSFVEDNRLKSGDACVFELIDPSPTTKLPVLKVHILRGDLPPELQAKEDAARGKAADAPVTIE